MSEPRSNFLAGAPRLHYLEWNPAADETIVLLHGSSANAWWWEPMAAAMPRTIRLLALDQRGHGDSEWVSPPAYKPTDYADDVARFVETLRLGHPLVAGHSMGGLSALAFANEYPRAAAAIAAIDVAVVSSRGRDRFMRRLRALPTVAYPDLETAKARYRLIPHDCELPAGRLAMIADKSLARTADGRWSLKFDRESFFGGDGLDVAAAIRGVCVPLLLVRGGQSRVMTEEGARKALEANPAARLVTIPDAHHHVPLEAPKRLAEAIVEFATSAGAHG